MNRLRRCLTLVLPWTLLAIVPACGDGADGDAYFDSPAPLARLEANDSIVGRTFLLQSAEGRTLVPGTRPVVSFTESSLRFDAGCNTIGGPYEMHGSTLVVGQLVMTKIGCELDLLEQEDWVTQFFSADPELLLVGNELTLKTPTATLRWLDRVVADPDRPLVGPTWTVGWFITKTGNAAFLIAPKPTFVFSADGRVTIEAPCSTGRGRFSVEADQITLRDVSYTKRACASRAEDRTADWQTVTVEKQSMQVDQRVQELVRDGVFTRTIVAGELTLRRGDQGVVAYAP